MVLSRALLMAGEHERVGLHAFAYYFMTTVTLIGYGDLLPGSLAGRYLAVFVLMPGAVALFATVLARPAACALLSGGGTRWLLGLRLTDGALRVNTPAHTAGGAGAML